MLQPPTIAVVIPNYNDSRYIPKCLRSVLEQPSPPDQVIVIDDASTDNSVAIIRAVIEPHRCARLIVNAANLGVNGAVAAGLQQVTADYVLFLSANDFVLPGIFAKAREGFSRSPEVGLWSAMAWLVNEDDAVIRLHMSPVVALADTVFSADECAKLAYRVGNWFTGSTLIYRRDAFNSIGGFDHAYGALTDLITAWAVASRYGAAYSPEPLAAFRIHADSYCVSTLKGDSRMDEVRIRLAQRGPALSPRLFNSAFIDRVILRFRFAALRYTGGQLLEEIADHATGWKRAWLRGIHGILPRGMQTLRVAIGFLILLPFDVVPTIVHRCFGWVIVRMRHRKHPLTTVGSAGLPQ